MTCIRYVPVNEQGDRDRQSGYLYDERDGTGVGYMDGIAVDRRRSPARGLPVHALPRRRLPLRQPPARRHRRARVGARRARPAPPGLES